MLHAVDSIMSCRRRGRLLWFYCASRRAGYVTMSSSCRRGVHAVGRSLGHFVESPLQSSSHRLVRHAVAGIAPCRRRGWHGGTLLVPPRRLRSNKSGSKRCDVQAVEGIELTRAVDDAPRLIGSAVRQPLCSFVLGA